MKHILHYMEKYDDVAETLKSAAMSVVMAILIMGLAPAIMMVQAAGF